MKRRDTNNSYQKLFYSLVGTLIVVLCLYGYFLNETVHHIVERKDLEDNTALVATEVSQMESRYLAGKESLTLDYAYSHGFVAVNPDYIEQTDRALTLRD
jgi:hypothetical protein